eukprot:TRINITY_DN185_c0_g1_i1.p1 TRINITY_DN185_c0_g1~~TRINITY_DN185_c0_g1_i1.p1  ORF type:complete len:118 (+),score=21.97 TRINITY_DN185_c0_g1_i1:58-411(+)
MVSKVTVAFVFATLLALLVIGVAAFSGRGTWYYPGLGACGWTNNNGQYVVALNAAQWDNKAHCGAKVSISAQGKSVTAEIVDLCPGCPYGGLDMSPATFQALGNLNQGVLNINWNYA